MSNLYKKFISKTGFVLFITLISLVGLYFFISKEGMQDNEDYYTNSAGIQIPLFKNRSCVNSPDGERICEKDGEEVSEKSMEDAAKSKEDVTTKKHIKTREDRIIAKLKEYRINTKPKEDEYNRITTKPDEYKINTKERPFIPPKETTFETSSAEPVPANCSSLIMLDGPVYVEPNSILKKYRNNIQSL